MRAAGLLVAFVAAAFVGCGGDDEPAARRDPPPAPPPRAAAERPARSLRIPSCPRDLANCRAAVGRIVYVERVDPDGDGDAHFVLAGGSVTGPGLSVIDVRRDLRPDPLPRAGDLVTASGPVFRGSYGQRQIEARELRVSRR